LKEGDLNERSGGEESQDLRELLRQKEAEIKRLEKQLESKQIEPEPTPEEPLIYADQTLRRLVQRVAMILQAEKIVIMFYDRDRAELIGMPPAFCV